MCQTIFQNQEKEKLFNDIVKNKATQKINSTKKELQLGINNIENEINTIQERLKKYKKELLIKKHIENILMIWLFIIGLKEILKD